MSCRKKMLILRGNSAPAGKYPDERGNLIAWPKGALHEWAASEYARRSGYEPVVVDEPGQPQGEKSPQATAALKVFLENQRIAAFYGFSGGGYNLRHILEYLARNNPEPLHRIDLVVVVGVEKEKSPKSAYEVSNYNMLARRKVPKWEPAKWEVVYKTNPEPKALPTGLPEGTSTHMFGPDVLLAETPAGRYRDFTFDDDCNAELDDEADK